MPPEFVILLFVALNPHGAARAVEKLQGLFEQSLGFRHDTLLTQDLYRWEQLTDLIAVDYAVFGAEADPTQRVREQASVILDQATELIHLARIQKSLKTSVNHHVSHVRKSRLRTVGGIAASGTERIKSDVENIDDLETCEIKTFDEALDRAIDMAEKGDVVLFSPAFSSFGKFFINEYDREDQFMNQVKGLN